MSTRVQYLGHSCILIESADKRILVDPFLAQNPLAALKPDDVEADFVVVTHGHADHLGDTIPIARRTGATVISNFEIGEWLKGHRVQHVHGQQPGGSHMYDFGRLKFTLAYHGSALPDGTYGGVAAGLHFFFKDGIHLYHAGDTALFGDMKLIGEDRIDLALLPIGDYFTMGPDDAIRALGLLTPKKVVPIHYDTFELIKQDAQAFAAQVRAVTSVEPIVPKPGDWINL